MTVLHALVLAAAGGGSSGFGGGGGGGSGGGGFGGGSGSGSGGSGPWWLWVLIAVGFALFVLVGVVAERRRRARRRARVARTHAVAVEAADDDPWFAADVVNAEAARLFCEVQAAWDGRQLDVLDQLVGPDLMVEWRRRLDDFAAKGWHNRVRVVSGPEVEYVGLVNREDDTEDRVVVRLEAQMRDVVETRTGGIVKKDGASSEEVAVAEFWTLARRGERWVVVSIEQDAEGAHHLEAPLVPSPWSDGQRLSDETALERATADAVGDVSGLVDVEYAGDAHRQALDLSLVDERFSPHVLEAAARRAVAAWAEAVDGDDGALRELAGEEAIRALLYPGERSRLVVRGPRLEGVRIAALDADAKPPRLAVEARVRGRRYVEDRDTLGLLSGSRDAEVAFTERWTMVLDGAGDGPADQGSPERPLRGSPWRIGAAAPVG